MGSMDGAAPFFGGARARLTTCRPREAGAPGAASRSPMGVEVRVVGDGYNTTSLVTWAGKKLGELERGGESFDGVWVVFDRDDVLPRAFNRAVEEVRRRDQSREADAPSWSAAGSNEAFELWYLVHVQSIGMDARMDRLLVAEKLGTHLRQARLGSYTKNRPDLGNSSARACQPRCKTPNL